MAENGLKDLSEHSLAFEETQAEKRKWQNKILKVDISLSITERVGLLFPIHMYVCVCVCDSPGEPHKSCLVIHWAKSCALSSSLPEFSLYLSLFLSLALSASLARPCLFIYSYSVCQDDK